MNKQGAKFKEIRKLLGLTQQEVADMLGIHQGFVSTYERDKLVNAEARLQLAKFTVAIKAVMREQGER